MKDRTMIGSKEDIVQKVVAHLQGRADAIGVRAALDEAGDILREAARRIGHGRQEGGYAGGEYLTKEPVAALPKRA
jgi:hypothetical protein